MGKSKTLEMKRTECMSCPLVDKAKKRQGKPDCPVKNPKIRNGHCLDRMKAIEKKGGK